MSVFNKFAGFTLGEADIIRRAMAKKKVKEFTSYKDKFVKGMMDKGGKRDKVEAFWEQLLKFAEYAFNKSHSCAYAFVAYYTAWLKYHYPKEYTCAVLNTTKIDKLGQVIKDSKSANIEVFPPDINTSENDFSLNDTGIVYGLGYIKNVGNRADTIIEERRNNGRFLSLSDFVLRTRAQKDVVESFIKAGVFDSLCPNRKALLQLAPEYAEYLKKIKLKEKALEELNEGDEKAEKIKAQIKAIIDELNSLEIDFNADENHYEKLLDEKAMLGDFISAHLLDYYEIPKEDSLITISDLNGSAYSNICGIVSELKVVKRKSDGNDMAFFTLEDKTGSVDVCCFAKQFKKFGSLLTENAAIQVKGMCQVEVVEKGDEEESVFKIILDGMTPLRERKNSIILYIESVMDWTDNVRYALNPYIDKDGYPLVVYDKLFGVFMKTKLYVSKDILNNQNGWETFFK